MAPRNNQIFHGDGDQTFDRADSPVADSPLAVEPVAEETLPLLRTI